MPEPLAETVPALTVPEMPLVQFKAVDEMEATGVKLNPTPLHSILEDGRLDT